MGKRNFGFPATADDPVTPASEPAWGPIRDAAGEIIAFARADHQAKMGAADDMLAALRVAVKVAEEARREWDAAPDGMRAGKILIALAGGCPGYRADVDKIHAAITKAESRP